MKIPSPYDYTVLKRRNPMAPHATSHYVPEEAIRAADQERISFEALWLLGNILSHPDRDIPLCDLLHSYVEGESEEPDAVHAWLTELDEDGWLRDYELLGGAQ